MLIFYSVPKSKFRFGLQVFDDTPPQKILKFWEDTLKMSPVQFWKVVITPARGKGTYKNKVKYGVLTIHVSNKKLRNIMVGEIEKLQGLKYYEHSFKFF